METLLFALWYFLPAGVANAAPIIAAKLPYVRQWSVPLDGARSWRGKRIFGAHKTWRGVIAGIIAATLVVYAEQLIYQQNDIFVNRSLDYLAFSPILLGFLFGFGALAGDAIKSFFKRRRNIDSGRTWFPFDQIDYIIGACLLAAIVAPLGMKEYLAIIAVWFVLHLIFSYIGYLLHLKASPI